MTFDVLWCVFERREGPMTVHSELSCAARCSMNCSRRLYAAIRVQHATCF